MKRASNSYRLQLIKEIATRKERLDVDDPMASYIQQLLDSGPNSDNQKEQTQRFIGNHFDAHTGGWVSDEWE
ncbi:hypothetical protein [Vibrio hepatarius]|uniref:hypothetical protein n=1 Tax=Vibrio hepatarius TaxID=171383 RepID=UPI001C09102E|nr:hypothetical protein [Vibrio hepatarius]MBU2898191.1 hypothetical protein [Vibrio hepatarius]